MSTERRIRIGDWLVPYDDAVTEVVLERKLADILSAALGDDENCMNSRCIKAQRNAHVFPHPVYIVSTIKSRVYIVDRLDESGEPAHAVRYELSARDGRLISAHDKYGAGEPGELKLRVPSVPKGVSHSRWSGWVDPDKGHGRRRDSRPVTSKGADARFKVAVGAFREGRA